jgi:uncharacterized membrane protein
MLSRFFRFVKHRWHDVAEVRRVLDTEAWQRLEGRIAASERRHLGQIRICVEAGLPSSYLWRNARPRERAIAMFSKLRIWDTERNNGVLIYLLLADHAIEIVGDRGINRHVSPAQWQTMVDHLREALRAGHFEEGLTLALEEVSAVLVHEFPRTSADEEPNELDNTLVIR